MPQDLQSQLNDLADRVSTLDGIGLQGTVNGQPVTSVIAQIKADIAGLKKTLGNVNMGYQTGISTLHSDFQAFKSQVCSILGIPSS